LISIIINKSDVLAFPLELIMHLCGSLLVPGRAHAQSQNNAYFARHVLTSLRQVTSRKYMPFQPAR